MSTITTPNALQGWNAATVNFENIAGLDGKAFGFEAGQPYTNIGLTFYSSSIVATANLNSFSHGVAVRSDAIYTIDNQNSLVFVFSIPQMAVGFFYRDILATSFIVMRFDTNGNMIEQGTFKPGQGYAGFISRTADIARIEVYAPHQTADQAVNSRSYIDDLSFASGFTFPPILIYATWLWVILIGYILLTPIGPLCIVCNNPISNLGVWSLGIVTLILGGIGLWREVTRQR